MVRFDVAAIGELLIDFTPSGVNELDVPMFAMNPGGAPANVLTMISQLGGSAAFLGKVGKDSFGSFLAKVLAENNIDASGLVFDDNVPTTLAFVHLDAKGDRSFSFYRNPGADLMLGKQDVDLSLIDGCSIFHFGSVSLSGEPSRSSVQQAVRYAKDRGKIISYDPNYRPLLWDSEEKAVREIRHMLPMADVVKVSEEEMTLLSGQTDPEEGARTLAQYGATLVVVTLGPDGAYCHTRHGGCVVPTYDLKVVDTTGAGDAFWGAFLYQLRGLTLTDIARLSSGRMTDILDFANAAGSLTTTKKGAIAAMPSVEAIRECMGTGNKLNAGKRG